MKHFNSILAIMITGLTISACSSQGNNKTSDGGVAAKTPEKASIPVKVMTLSKTKISRTIDYTATILPFEEVNMAPSTPGRIEKYMLK